MFVLTSGKGSSSLISSSVLLIGVCRAVSSSNTPLRSLLTDKTFPSQNTTRSFVDGRNVQVTLPDFEAATPNAGYEHSLWGQLKYSDI